MILIGPLNCCSVLPVARLAPDLASIYSSTQPLEDSSVLIYLASKKRNFSNHLIPVRMRRNIVQMVTA
jgi:hypothetical protein